MTVIGQPLPPQQSFAESGAVFVTYHDVIDHLIDFLGGQVGTREIRQFRRAVQEALRYTGQYRNWSYFYRRARITTSPQYNQGSVQYDSGSRNMVLADGTWPDDASKGNVLINNVQYRVEARLSESTLLIDAALAPEGDFPAGTAYTWSRQNYTLPENCQSTDYIQDLDQQFWPAFVSPGDWLMYQRSDMTPNQPRAFTVMPDEELVNRIALVFTPPPDVDYRFDYIMRAAPLPLRIDDESAGTVTTSDRTVTGTGTNFTQGMVNSVIRFSLSQTKVTGLEGDNPYFEEKIIKSVDSATICTIDSPLESDVTNVAYRISDIVDIQTGPMYTAFLRKCEAVAAELLLRDDALQREAKAREAFDFAAEADAKTFRGQEPAAYRGRVRPRDSPYVLNNQNLD